MASLLPTAEIKIGSEVFGFRPLTLGQIQRLSPVLDKAKAIASLPVADIVALTVDFLTIALQRCNPEISADRLLDIETTPNDLVEAMNAILLKSGFKLVPKAADAGEAPAPQVSI